MSKVWLMADYKQAEAMVVAWRGPIPMMKQWFLTGEDIHLNVAKLIGKVIEEQKITIANGLWMGKHWTLLTKKDKERQIGKNSVHSNNYDTGKNKFAQITGLPVNIAELVQIIYHGIFPQIKGGYQKWIRDCLDKDRTIINPLGWKRTFYGNYYLDCENIRRAAYAWYAQSTIGLMNVRALAECCELYPDVFVNGRPHSPALIKSAGMDVQLQVHDSLGIVVEEDEVEWHAKRVKQIMERPITILGEELIVPIDFKVGPSWGELHDYELPMAA